MLIWLASVAQAAFWDRPLRTGYTLGLNLVVNLGPVEDRARVGVAVDGEYQRFWADVPYYHDGPVRRPAPELTLAAHVGWTHPVVWSEVSAVAGPMQPLVVADGGFLPLIGAQGGAGLQIATDGSAGPMLVGTVLGPMLEGRIEATRWRSRWHAPRLLVGPTLSLTCCTTLL